MKNKIGNTINELSYAKQSSSLLISSAKRISFGDFKIKLNEKMKITTKLIMYKTSISESDRAKSLSC